MRFRWHLRCRRPAGEVLLRKALVLSLAVVAPFIATDAFLTQARVQNSALVSHDVLDGAAAAYRAEPSVQMNGIANPDADPEEDDTATVDLFGNRVADAVAQYRFDKAGGLYELHSPQTELPHLRPPRS
jgi:hypothetical protein